MMKSVSLESCSACTKVAEKKSCCESNNSYPVNYKSEKDKCCETKVIVSRIDDQFLLVKTDPVTELSKLTDSVVYNDIIISSENSICHISQDSSPPPKSQNHIYIINSVFLI
jgi:hypothetical protein